MRISNSYCTICVLSVVFSMSSSVRTSYLVEFLSIDNIQAEIGRLVAPIGRLGPCIIGPRLVLNLREAYYLPFKEECNAILDKDLQLLQETGVEDAGRDFSVA